MYAMHRSPRLWRDPLAFKPERFLAGTPEAEEVRGFMAQKSFFFANRLRVMVLT